MALSTVNKQPRVHMRSRLPLVPYDQIFPFLTPTIGPDKTNELQTLFDRYKRAEIPRDSFYLLMKDIVGEEVLSSALPKIQEPEINRSQATNGLEQKSILVNNWCHLTNFFPFLTPQIDLDKASEIRTLADQYQRGEIPKHTFVPLMKAILGERMLRSAMAKIEEQKINQQVAVNEQPGIQTNSSHPMLVLLDQLALCLVPQIDRDKASEMKTLVHNYLSGELPHYNFLPHMKRILGEQMLRSAGAKLLEHKRNPHVTTNKQPRIEIPSIKSTIPLHHLFHFLIPQIDQDKAIKIRALGRKYQRSKLEVTVIGQPGSEINPNNLKVSLSQMLSSLIPQVDTEKAIELQTLAEKYKKGEIPHYDVVRRMKGIVGEQILKSAADKVLAEQFNLHVTVHEQPRIQINSSNPVVTFDQLFHFLIPHIDESKAIELQTLVHKYERGKIPKCDLFPLMEDIVGKQILRSAVAKALARKTSTSLYIEV